MKEVGCLHYAFAADVTRDGRFQLSEWWEDSAALESHFQSKHMAAFRAGMSALRIENRVFKKYWVSRHEDLELPGPKHPEQNRADL